MIKILEDLLIEATTNPNVPGHLVAGLRKAVDDARCGSVKGETFAFSGVLPTPFDSQEEAQRAAGVPVPHTTEPVPSLYHVCIKTTPRGHQVGAVVQGLQAPYLGEYWAPCDKDGWVSAAAGFIPAGLKVEFRGSRDEGANPTEWRPARAPQVSAIDEMAEQMERWAAPTREDACDPESCGACQLASRQRLAQDTELPARESVAPSIEIYQAIAWFDKNGKIQGRVSDEQLDALCEQAQADLEARNGWEAQRKAQEVEWFESVKAAPALAVQEGGSHYKDMQIQPVEYIHANGLGYFEGNVVKYVSRWRAKGGLQDLKKARHYLDLLIELEGGVK